MLHTVQPIALERVNIYKRNCREYTLMHTAHFGDVVQVVNEYGQEATSRVTEIVISQDENGESLNPTFTSTEKTDN